VVIKIEDDFDLDKIAGSGQCFRWSEVGNNTYRIIAGDSCLYIESPGNGLYELSCTEDDYNRFWFAYFDLGENYGSIRSRIDREKDPFLWEAAEAEKGIRILRQDPWEILITFIISQNRNIPAIRHSVELIAESCGEKKLDLKGLEYYAFPGPEAVSALTEQELSECRLGYRCKYVHAAAKAVSCGEIDLNHLSETDDVEAMDALNGLFGVGVKVASCVSLFGLHHTDAFPVDVWMKRILKEQYPAGYPFERYTPYNGIYQQYMFACYRHR
jgi:N-glycosylase/DNA lyase